MKRPYILEICAGSIESAYAALQGGASRIELCSALPEGGITPPYGAMIQAHRIAGLKVHVLIRPRGGDFLYSKAETEQMTEDILMAQHIGVEGIVIGALTAKGDIDVPAMEQMITAAEGMDITFHRAFDLCRDPMDALETIIGLRCHRLLTSGQASSAEAGTALLKQLVAKAGERLTIMPGGGINAGNIAGIAASTGAREFHASASSIFQSRMEFHRNNVTMGKADTDEYARKETDPAKVSAILHALRQA